ncbi:glycosyltransferase family 2 protein [Marixanthomonas sp. SCSIO 43207]|uniref:glycosyltransferase family 2 protein n=1 Tax=Marixanthomonas sp. SCSIO 43207 TaxID=2779360 RepID=UPI001CA9FCA7|nr:glycosyltransferase family 2 protein [Marixanthomonas sp. SCSIO 43207]UAB81225.1 glycosyltransferase family 2 protein [Marixanthomonas sp. SCSIO 43207]
MNPPIISIIIPTYNRGTLLSETLNSIVDQKFTNWECLIVDDGSIDNTSQIVQAYCEKDTRFIYLQRPKNRKRGGNAARNFGYEKAKGKYVQWFDSDDIMKPNLLKLQLENIINNKKAFSICLFDRYDANLNIIKVKAVPNVIHYNIYYDFLSKSLKANLPTILFSKKILEGYSLSEDLLKSQEYEFLQRFFREHYEEGVLLNEVLVKVRRHSDSITQTLTAEKCASALQAILITRNEMPKSPKTIQNKVSLQYLATLYLPFSHKMTVIFFKYLFKLYRFDFFKSLVAIPFLTIMYFIYLYLKMPIWYYKNIYKLYK